jgi:hypothetical protein
MRMSHNSSLSIAPSLGALRTEVGKTRNRSRMGKNFLANGIIQLLIEKNAAGCVCVTDEQTTVSM